MIALKDLAARVIATIAGATVFGFVLAVAQVLINFGTQRRFNDHLLQQPT